ncbi:MAG: response regulator transcription factor [Flavobacterium sp.]
MKILIADDHPFTLQGTKSFVESYGYKVADACSNGISALNLIILHQPDIAILDINMPGLDGLDVAKRVQEDKMWTKVILLTMHKEMTLYKKATEYGVYGYILKEHAQTELEKCLDEVKKGNKYVSPFLEDDLIISSQTNLGDLANLTISERKILEQVAQQKTSKQIAELLFLSEKTVEGHRSKIIEKLGLPKEKNSLLKWAMKQNF